MRARATGALVADVLYSLRDRVEVGTNLLDVDRWAQQMILEAGAVSCYVDYAPAFGNGPFGHYICTSVNDAVLHGLPHDYALADGDLLSLDLAVSLDGVVADSAITSPWAPPSAPRTPPSSTPPSARCRPASRPPVPAPRSATSRTRSAGCSATTATG
ncbi:hypothetical protein GCM10025868_20010 [Angustibacter aerolatus]|uniref:Peptidase M24 domain-containing protein n=1 Tax=Angustibacter aerolatus TaxID=1162965 RepID=A0ABQ6JIY0_9ACTN|nr:hypothetical protein GCM10025868_20010 [Angustibacter aerolatus]